MEVKSLKFLGYPGYAVREDGLVFNTNRLEVVKPDRNKFGYYRVCLYTDPDTSYKEAVHRLVAFAFVEGYQEGLHVNHIDNNPANNQVGNLEWVTPKENIAHSIVQGRFKYAEKAKKLTDEEIYFIKTSGIGLKQISEMFNVSKSAILYHRNRGV